MAVILVTGATGTVGSAVIRALLARETAQVRAGAHYPEQCASLREQGVEVVPCVFEDSSSLARAMEGVSHLFLLTPPGPATIEFGERAIDAAKQAGVAHVVRLSVLGANSGQGGPIAEDHRVVEEYLRASGMGWTILRPNYYMEDFFGYVHVIGGNACIFLPLGETPISYIAARDIGEVAAVALTQPGHLDQAYDLTGPEGLTLYRAAEVLTQALRRPITYVPVSDDAVRGSLGAAGVPAAVIESYLALFAYARTGAMGVVSPAVHEITGHAPQAFAAWAKEHAKAFRQQAA